MELGNEIAISSVALGFCGVVITAILRFAGSKKCNGNTPLSEKVFKEYRHGMELWRSGIDSKISKIFDKLDELKTN